jgi:hypothetical protein
MQVLAIVRSTEIVGEIKKPFTTAPGSGSPNSGDGGMSKRLQSVDHYDNGSSISTKGNKMQEVDGVTRKALESLRLLEPPSSAARTPPARAGAAGTGAYASCGG